MTDITATDVVTGALSYTGKYVTRRLLTAGRQVITLTNHPDRANPFGDSVRPVPYRFDDPDALAASLHGADTLYNTYWVRFDYGDRSHERAIANTQALFAAAVRAGIRRIVHVSIANASSASTLPYFHGKGLLEESLIATGLPYAIMRPTVIFGDEDVLINNVAWLLRRFPFFAIPGSGDYLLQPIFVEDMADCMVWAGCQPGDLVMDAAGPDVFTFDAMVRLIRSAVGSRALLIHTPPGLALALSRVASLAVGDVILTAEEVDGLMAGLLVSDTGPAGHTRLADWLDAHRETIGAHYANELRRHYHVRRQP